jgi:16S rRNA processing protein RimM
VIVGAHGIKGAVRIKPFTAEPNGLAAYGPVSDEAGARRFAVQTIGVAGGAVLAKLSGVADRNAAEALKGLRLYVARAALPQTRANEYYHADLIGLAAETADGRRLGTVLAVHNFGAGDVLELALAQGGTAMLPFSHAAVPEVDLAGGRVVVDPPPGTIEPQRPARKPRGKAAPGKPSEARP